LVGVGVGDGMAEVAGSVEVGVGVGVGEPLSDVPFLLQPTSGRHVAAASAAHMM
jgi:hypothetical protein